VSKRSNVVPLRRAKKAARVEWPDAMQEYLAARGIKREWAEANGLRPIDAAAVKDLLGKHHPLARGRSAIFIPHYDLDGRDTDYYSLNFAGQPPAPGHEPGDGEKVLKALSKPGEPSMAYVPRLSPPGSARSNREAANDPRERLIVCEGPIKALCAALLGFRVLAVPGVDNFHVKGLKDRPVELLRDFAMRGRSVDLIYDSDADTNENVRRARGEFTRLLKGLAADVSVVHLPALPGRKSTGIDDYLVEHGRAGLDKLRATLPRLPDSLRSGSYFFDGTFEPVRFAIAPYFPRSEVVEAHGAHGLCKSTLLLYACLSVATGEPWGTCTDVTQGRAAFLTMEDKARTVRDRILAALKDGPKFADGPRRNSGKLERAIRENFMGLTREDAKSLALTELSYAKPEVRQAAVDRISDLCAGFDLVVLETAGRLNPAGETNEALAVLALALEEIAERTGACVVLVRHVSKEVARNGSVDSYGGRGGGSLADAARSTLSFERPGDHPFDPVLVHHTKGTHTGRGPVLAWKPRWWPARSGSAPRARPTSLQPPRASGST
jgi:AAA domain/Domain of unknown function (DUF3854)